MQKIVFAFLLQFAFVPAKANAGVRHISTKKDQIITVRTALGIATIVQVPDRPTSVVIGDQASFKVEYLDKAITIKPLIAGARTNLYVYTDWQRYNIKLVPTSKVSADYVVYIKPKVVRKKPEKIKWKKFSNYLKNEKIKLSVSKIGNTKNGLYLIDFNLTSKKKENFKPEWIWLTQNGKTIPIHRLFIDELKLRPGKEVSGLILAKRNDLNRSSPLQVEMRRKKTSYLTIKEPRKW
jgi:hypothetical protein